MQNYQAFAGFHSGQQPSLCCQSPNRHKSGRALWLGSLLLVGSVLVDRPVYALAFDTAHWLNIKFSNRQRPTTTAKASTATALTAQQAESWQLTATEWQRYNTLMQGVAGRWYATLNPPEVLGLLARDDTERAHYAMLVVRQRKARIDRELAFNRAIHQAWVSKYPTLKPVRPFDTRPFRVVKHAKP